MEQTPPPHVVIVPSPGISHLIPLVEFARRLVHRHSLSVTFFIPTIKADPPSPTEQSVLADLPPSVRHVFLPPPAAVLSLPADHTLRPETLMCLAVSSSLPSLRSALASLSAASRVSALIVDLFSTDAFDVVTEFGIPPYLFFPSTAMALSLCLYLPQLDASVSCEYRDLTEPVRIPGCIPVSGSDLFEPVQDRTNDAYKAMLRQVKRYRMAEGIMVNSFTELEAGAIRALQLQEEEEEEEEEKKPPVYPIGPVVKMGDPNGAAGSDECLRWLDEQPPCSVVFVSFGSGGGSLSREQIGELALGLEASGARFLWVVRSPNDNKSAGAGYLAGAGSAETQNGNDPDFLPPGFLERSKGRGKVVTSWAPQAEVLSHRATGGFLSHCGWNSTLESMVRGVPVIAWPLYAEQHMNAAMLTAEELKVALRPRGAGEAGVVVRREEIRRVVRELMEGEEGKGVRIRMGELKEAAAKVLSQEGSSTRSLAELAHKWKAHTLPPSQPKST